MYALWDTATNTVVQGPWSVMPNRVRFSAGDVVYEPKVGSTHPSFPTQFVVNYVVVNNPPTQYDTRIGETYDYDAETFTLTVTYLYNREPGAGPTSQDVEEEMERRIHALYNTAEQFKGLRGALKLVYKVANGGTLTAAEQTRLTNITNAFDNIDAIDQARADIVALDPIPDDYDADSRWP